MIKTEGADDIDYQDPAKSRNIGIYFKSDGSLELNHDTIWVKPQDTSQDPLVYYSGVGIFFEGGTLDMENTTINDKRDASFIGIAFVRDFSVNNSAYIDNSEIYSCVEEYCHTVSVNHDDQEMPAGTIVHISSTLLHGGPVNWDSNPFKCMWVTDEDYDGYGWPSNGTGSSQLHLSLKGWWMNPSINPTLLYRLLVLAAICLLVGSILALSSASAVVQSSEYEVSWYTFDGGGTVSNGGDYTIMGTIGQPDAGQHSDMTMTYDLTGGFWSWVARYLGYLPLIKKP